MPAPSRQPVPKKMLFAAEYLKDQNGTQAAIRAGYSPRSAHAQGTRLLQDAEVKKYISDHTAQAMEKAGVSAERWLEEVNHSAFFDPETMFAANGTLLPISEMPERMRRAIAGFEVVETFEMQGEGKNRHRVWTGYIKKVKLVSKEGTLNLCAKHLGFIKDKLEVEVTDARVSALTAAQARRDRAKGSK